MVLVCVEFKRGSPNFFVWPENNSTQKGIKASPVRRTARYHSWTSLVQQSPKRFKSQYTAFRLWAYPSGLYKEYSTSNWNILISDHICGIRRFVLVLAKMHKVETAVSSWIRLQKAHFLNYSKILYFKSCIKLWIGEFWTCWCLENSTIFSFFIESRMHFFISMLTLDN